MIKNNKTLLIIAHCPSPNTKAMGDALLSGAQSEDILSVTSLLKSPFDCNHLDVLQSDAIILFTTENFGYMSGAIKDFFERIYYPCLEDKHRNEAKPFALVVKAGLDGTGSIRSVHNITNGLKWRRWSRQAARYFRFFSRSCCSRTFFGSLDAYDLASVSVIRTSRIGSVPRSQRDRISTSPRLSSCAETVCVCC